MAVKERFEYVLGFSVDASKAKSEMNQLQDQLRKIATQKNLLGEDHPLITSQDLIDSGKLQADFLQLGTVLKNSFNKTTGQLNLNKMLAELDKYGLKWEQVSNALATSGDEGVAALQKINTMVVQSDANFVDLGKHAKDFVDQLYRSAKIQLSYKALSAMTSIFRDSYHYVVDLNKSLTNIQIVTQKSNQSMAEFAKNANKSAQSLSSKTLGYTDAALIYYQQGLNDKQVKERTDVTIKMANVTGQTASEVSDQMTAIWNNFAKGSDNLEHFADVITALGAATASSSKEISDGLQQFAAVANTVGLSYDYATSALATVVAKTRQSADSVGNSFKTIFARLQSLKQGDTLEDDTTLTKYSQALATVGVNIKLQNGELKNMDTILDELGSKWSTLNMEQKNALAYTVAGARQYTNFIALLDNWDYMKQNLDVAKGADGTLQKQQEVYTKSFEAATRRLTAAWEEFYTKILNDKALVWLVDRLTDLTKLINKITDGLGGLPGLLGTIAFSANAITQGGITKGILNIGDKVKQAYFWASGKSKEVQNDSLFRLGKDEELNFLEGHNFPTTLKQKYSDYYFQYKKQRVVLEDAKKNAYSDEEVQKIEEKIQYLKQSKEWLEEQVEGVGEVFFNPIADSTFKKYVAQGKDIEAWTQKKQELQAQLAAQQQLANAGTGNGNPLITDLEKQIKTLTGKINQAGALKNQTLDKMDKGISDRAQILSDLLVGAQANHPALNKIKGIQDQYQKRLEELTNAKEQGTAFTDDELLKDFDGDIAKLTEEQYRSLQVRAEQIANQKLKDIADKNGVKAIFDNIDKANSAGDSYIKQLEKIKKMQDAINGLTSLTAGVTTLTSSLSGLGTEIGKIMEGEEPDWTTIIGGLSGIASGIYMIAAAGKALKMSFPEIAVISTILTSLVLLFNYWKANTPEAKLKKAKEATEQLKTAAENAKNEYSQLVSTLNSLSDKYKAFENLKEGTTEWTDAVQDLNDELREVILKYNLLYGKDWAYDEKGRIRINDDAQKDIINQARAKKQKSAIVAASSATGVEVTEINNQIADKRSKKIELLHDLSVRDKTNHTDNNYTGSVTSSDEANNQKYSTIDAINTALYNAGVSTRINENSSTEDWKALAEMQVLPSDLQEKVVNYLDQIVQLDEQIAQLTDESRAQFDALASTIIEQNDNLTGEDTEGVSQWLSQAFTSPESEAGKIFANFKNNIDFEEEKKNFVAGLSEEAAKAFNNAPESVQQQALFGQAVAAGDLHMTKQEVSSGKDLIYTEGNQSDSAIAEKLNAIDVTEDELDVYTDLLKVKYNMTAANENEERSLKALAVRQLTLNKGLENLSSTWDKYSQVLSKSGTDFDELSEDYVKGLAEIKKNMEQVFGVDVSAKFIRENLGEIEKLAKGDVAALDELGKKATLDYVANLDITINNEDAENGVAAESLRQKLTDMVNNLSGQLPNLEIGADLDMDTFEADINEMLRKGQISLDQLEKMMSSMGMVPDIEHVTDPEGLVMHFSGTIGEGTSYEQKINADLKGALTYPVVKGIKKSGMSQAVSKANRTGGSKTSKKGGGGSKKDKKQASDEIERYHVIKNKLEDINHQLDLISMAKDRAFGKDRLALLDKEIAKYKQLASAQEQYIAEINEHYKADQAVMAGYGALFDENGTITNYVEMMNAQIAKFNSSLSDEAEKEYNNFKKALENYESSQDLFQEAQKQWHEYRQKIFDAQLEKIEYKLEFRVDIDDEELKYLEYLLDRLDDAAYDTAESIANLGKQIDLANDKSQAYTQSVKELLDLISNGNGEDLYGKLLNGSLNYESLLNNTLLADQDFNSAQWLEDLQKAYDGLIDQQKEFAQLWDDYIAKMEDFWDSWKEKFDDAEDRLGFLKDVASNYKNLIDILGKDNLGISDATMARLDATMSSAATEKAAASYKEYLAAKQAYDSAMAKDLDPEIIKHYKEAMEDAYQDMQSDQSDAAQQLEDEYKNAIDRIFEKWEKGISGIQKSLAQLAEQFEMQNTIKNLWLDTYDQAYQTAKLTKDIADSIQDTDVISNKQELASLMEEINERQASGVKMSQYELDAYRKEYELLLAKAALEDAQNAKNQVRMTRDAEGNMSYTYTADSKAIGEAEDNYNDVAYQFAQLNVGQINDAQQQIIQLYQDMEEALKGIDESDAERRQAVMDDYMAQIAFWEDQMQIAFDWNADLTEQTGYIQWNLADNFADTVLSQVTGYQTLQEMQAAFEASSRALLDNLADADKQHQDKVADLLNKTGLDVDNMEDKVNDNLDKIQDGIEDTADSVSDMSDEFVDALDKTITEAEQFEDVWDNVISAVIAKNNELISSISSMLDYYKRLTSAAMEAASAMGVNGGSIGSVSGSGGGGNGPGGGGTSTPSGGGSSTQYWVVYTSLDTYASGKSGPYSSLTAARNTFNSYCSDSSVTSAKIIDDNGKVYASWASGAKKSAGNGGSGIFGNRINTNFNVAFDTGGYTGEWGSEGRAAILHEKELVLNKADTANMLSIVSLVRDIVSGFGGMPSGANANFNLGIGRYVGDSSNIDQQVIINAEFPNATNREEIQAAFDQMAIQATQYIKKIK